MHRAALPHPALREALSLRPRRRLPPARSHHSQPHHQAAGLREIALRAPSAQRVSPPLAAHPVPHGAAHLALAQSLRLPEPTDRQQARPPARLLLSLPALLRSLLRLPRSPRRTLLQSLLFRRSARSVAPVFSILAKPISSSTSSIASSSSCRPPRSDTPSALSRLTPRRCIKSARASRRPSMSRSSKRTSSSSKSALWTRFRAGRAILSYSPASAPLSKMRIPSSRSASSPTFADSTWR